ncbi:uncharacterized protein LOC129768004 isoform X2 [Toxorhynchites rutilus septentrionalis]|uniref:uncharacterized protein LOC129768004 isoform X2 n=1 Tax=Toxorhynchites rutilus septentrionalis TaxID=329112 RepID=UPI00247A9861|nr:uncharacterized protein LOC129768004 isoform X2 [Toxorhynchites rutilus septentrionalis]
MASNAINSSMMTVNLQLADIFQYVGGGSRLIVEGERVFQANHLLLVGVQTVHEDGFTIFATCLKSSSPRADPHKISIRTRPSFEKWSFQCSCKTGMGKTHNGRFKTSSNVFPSVPLLTVTDLQQKWGKIAEKVADDMYKTTPLTAFCKKITNTKDTTEAASPAGLTHDEGTNILQLFVKGFPESGLAYEKKGREMKNIDKNDESDVLNTLLDIDVQSHSTESIDSLISIEENMTCSLLKSIAFSPLE